MTYLRNACPKQEPLDGSNMSRSSHETIELKNVTQVYKLNPSSLTLPIIFYVSENLLKSCFNFIIMATPFISSMSNHLTLTCLGSKLLEKHLATITKTLWALFNIQRSKVHVANKHEQPRHVAHILPRFDSLVQGDNIMQWTNFGAFKVHTWVNFFGNPFVDLFIIPSLSLIFIFEITQLFLNWFNCFDLRDFF